MSKGTKPPKDKQEVKLEEQKITNLTELLQREPAANINLRRRHEQDMANLKDYLKTDIIQQLLPVIDNFERSLKHVPKELENNEYVSGIKAIVRQFEKTISDFGVAKIETVGHEFNPALHEAVSM